MRKKKSPVGFITIALGFGVIAMCIFPTKFLIFTLSLFLIICGAMLLLKC